MATSLSKPSSATAKSKTSRNASGAGSAKSRRARGDVTWPARAGKRAASASASGCGTAGVELASANRGLLLLGRVFQRCEQLHDPVDDRLGPGGAAWHPGRDRDDRIDAALHAVAAVEDPTRAGAGADRHHQLRLRH